MTDNLASRIRRAEALIGTGSAENLNATRLDFAFAILQMRMVQCWWDSSQYPDAEAADTAIEAAAHDVLASPVTLRGYGETEPQVLYDDGDVDSRVETLISRNRELFWSGEDAIGFGPAKSPSPSG